MKINRFLSFLILSLTCLSNLKASDLITDIELATPPQTRMHSASQALELKEIAIDRQPAATQAPSTRSELDARVLTNTLIASVSPMDLTQQPTISTWRRATAWGTRIGGNILNLIGIPVSVAGGTLVAVHHDLNHPLGQIGLALTTLGVVMDRGGNILLETSQKEAATIEAEIERHTKRISKAADLTPDEVEILSEEFFGMSQVYQTYIGCASKADRIISRILSLVGPAGAITGATLMLTGEQTVGPFLAVAGALAFKAEGTFRAKADAYDAQIARHKTVELAKTKARLRLGSSTDSRISISLE